MGWGLCDTHLRVEEVDVLGGVADQDVVAGGAVVQGGDAVSLVVQWGHEARHQPRHQATAVAACKPQPSP